MDYQDYLNRWFGEFEEYHHIGKGKGVRAKLVEIINPDQPKLGAIVESIHTASLLHDDVIDRAETRRGLPSINAKFGDFTAIMLGDIFYSRAFRELVAYPQEVAEKVANAVYLLSQGELEDVKLSKNLNLDRKAYFSMIYKKTASLIEATCWSSAHLRRWEGEPFGLYGKNIGLAFQLIDDLLDIVGDPKVVGKPVMEDFAEGKTTLPYILLFERLPQPQREYLKSLYRKKLTPEEQNWIKGEMVERGVIDEVKKIAQRLVEEGKRAIAPYNLPQLFHIADRIITREK
jgi:octaprenyl-diphosphate synthase